MIMIVMIIAAAIGILSWFVLGVLEERYVTHKRISAVTGRRVQEATATLDKSKIIAKLAREQKVKNAKQAPLSARLTKAGVQYSAGQIRMMAAGLGATGGLLAMLFSGSIVMGLIAGLFGGLVVPRVGLSFLIARREAAFLDELPNALDMISRGLRAGMTLGSCMKQISESTAEPLRSEFAHVIDLQKLGIPLSDAIRKMPERIDLLDLRFFTIVIEIQQRSGGNLAEILENISGVIRGRKEMRAKIQALVSEAKVSSIIIGGLPLGFAALSWNSDPETFSKFWTETIGMILLGVAATLYTLGTLIFVKLATPKL